MSKVISAAQTETEMDDLLRHVKPVKMLGQDGAVQKLNSVDIPIQAKQDLLYHFQIIHWYLNH